MLVLEGQDEEVRVAEGVGGAESKRRASRGDCLSIDLGAKFDELVKPWNVFAELLQGFVLLDELEA